MLWQQAAGGTVTEAMQKAIDNEREDGATSRLLEQAEETFRDYAAQEDPTSAADHVPLKPSDDLTMSFNGFYNAYLQPYFGDRRPAPRRPGAGPTQPRRCGRLFHVRHHTLRAGRDRSRRRRWHRVARVAVLVPGLQHTFCYRHLVQSVLVLHVTDFFLNCLDLWGSSISIDVDRGDNS